MAKYKVHFAHHVEEEVFEILALEGLQVRGSVCNGKGVTVCGKFIGICSDGPLYVQQRTDPLPTTNKWSDVTCGLCLRGRKKFEFEDGFEDLLEASMIRRCEEKHLEIVNFVKRLTFFQEELEKKQNEFLHLHSCLEKLIRARVEEKQKISDYSLDKTRVLEV